MIEISVKVSDDDSTLTEKFLVHKEGICMSHEDADLKKMVDSVRDKFHGNPTDILVKSKYTW